MLQMQILQRSKFSIDLWFLAWMIMDGFQNFFLKILLKSDETTKRRKPVTYDDATRTIEIFWDKRRRDDQIFLCRDKCDELTSFQGLIIYEIRIMVNND